GEDRRHVETDAVCGERGDEITCEARRGIRDRHLDVHVLAPRCDLSRLACHLRKVVGEDLEAHGLVADEREDIARELGVVVDACLAHERRVRGEAGDHGVAERYGDVREACTVRKDLDLECRERWRPLAHGRDPVVESATMRSTASLRSATTWSGGSRSDSA